MKIFTETALNIQFLTCRTKRLPLLEGFNSKLCQIHDLGDASHITSLSDWAFDQRYLIMFLMDGKSWKACPAQDFSWLQSHQQNSPIANGLYNFSKRIKCNSIKSIMSPLSFDRAESEMCTRPPEVVLSVHLCKLTSGVFWIYE